MSDSASQTAATGEKRAREKSAGLLHASPRAKRRRTEVVVEVALPRNPAFDPCDYAAVKLASQRTIPDSQELQHSFPSAATTGGYQGSDQVLRSRTPSQSTPSQPSELPPPGDVSREGRTWSQPPLPPPELGQPHPGRRVSEPSSRLTISDGHGEEEHLSFGQRQIVTATNSQHSLAVPLELSGTSGHFNPSHGFLTQPEFDPYSQPLETSPATVGSRVVITESNGKSAATESQKSGNPDIQSSTLSGSHSAQVVPYLNSALDELRTLSQPGISPSRGGVIPASSLGPTNQASVSISSAVALERRSVPVDAIVSDTPSRRAHSAPPHSSGSRNHHPPAESLPSEGNPTTAAEKAIGGGSMADESSGPLSASSLPSSPTPPPTPSHPPDFEVIETALSKIGTAFLSLAAEIPRVRDLHTTRNHGQITAELRAIRTRLTQLESRTQNDRIKARNAGRYADKGDAARLEPLLSLRTGHPIPNCPGTVAHITNLSSAEATRILRALGVHPPRLLTDKREAVHWEFFQ